jgi:hypothetical protein
MTEEILQKANENRGKLKLLLERRKKIRKAIDDMRKMKNDHLEIAYVNLYDEVVGLKVDDLVQLLANSLWEISKEIATLNKEFEAL